jgi:probable rRNA maturation factor
MPVRFFYELEFKVTRPRKTIKWIEAVVNLEKRLCGEINYIFCSDKYLHGLNRQFLKHDTLTDIISFDSSHGKVLSGEIYISVDRIKENAKEFQTNDADELRRVMIHGVLHFCGYKDKQKTEKTAMRKKEEAYLSLWKRKFHVER